MHGKSWPRKEIYLEHLYKTISGGSSQGRYLFPGHFPEAELVGLKALGAEGTNGLGQVPEAGRAVEVQCLAGVVSQHPGEHWPLQATYACQLSQISMHVKEHAF